MVGDPNSAIDIINVLLPKPGELSLPLLEFDPIWASVHEHLRYSELLKTGK